MIYLWLNCIPPDFNKVVRSRCSLGKLNLDKIFLRIDFIVRICLPTERYLFGSFVDYFDVFLNCPIVDKHATEVHDWNFLIETDSQLISREDYRSALNVNVHREFFLLMILYIDD